MKNVLTISIVIFLGIVSCNKTQITHPKKELNNTESTNPEKLGVILINITQKKPFQREWRFESARLFEIERDNTWEKLNEQLQEVNNYCLKIDDSTYSEDSLIITIISTNRNLSLTKKMTSENFSYIYDNMIQSPLKNYLDSEELTIIYKESVVGKGK